MKPVKHILLYSVLITAALSLFLHPELSVRGVSRGLTVCSNSVLPALFPFFVLSDLWISLGYCDRLSRKAGPIMETVFHLPGETASAFLLGAVGGYPVGAQTVCRLFHQNRLSRSDAEAALLFCNNAGPAFAFGILGGTLFRSAAIGGSLWAVHLLSALLLGFMFRPAKAPNVPFEETSPSPMPFLPALTSAISQGGRTALRVCTFVLFFSILSEYLLAAVPGIAAAPALLGLLELAGGCVRLGDVGVSQETAFVLCSGLLGWGGFCVHCQTFSLLYEENLSPKRYLLGKSLHCLTASALACLLAPSLPLQVSCFAAETAPPVGAITLLCCLLVLLFLKSSSGKMPEHRI